MNEEKQQQRKQRGSKKGQARVRYPEAFQQQLIAMVRSGRTPEELGRHCPASIRTAGWRQLETAG